MTDILCAGGVPPAVADRLSRLGPVVDVEAADEDAIAAMAKTAVAIVARANAPITSRVMDAAPGLRVIARSGTGVDNVDLQAATERGVPVVITPDAGTNAVAEGALAMMLALGKRLPQLHGITAGGRWGERDAVDILDIGGSAVGIVGFGRIGRRVAELVHGLGADVVFFDPYIDDAAALGAVGFDARRVDSLEELVSSCEFITLHLPLTDQTRGLIDRELLACCRPGSVLVNASRGGLVGSFDDLAAALRDGLLGGVGLDVYDPEPPTQHPVFDDPRVIATPHMMALSRGGRARIYSEMCDGIEAVLAGKPVRSVANPQVYGPDPAPTRA